METSLFERMIQQVDSTILSISPGVQFPPPHLLKRLRDEEICRNGDFSRRSAKITADAKTGLRCYMTNNNSLAGVIRHQRLTYCSSISLDSILPCEPPKLQTVEYYQKSGPYKDTTLGQYITTLCDNSDSACTSSICGRTMGAHTITYTHNTTCVSVTIENVNRQLDDARLAADEDRTAEFVDPTIIIMWTMCSICGTRTPVVPMSDTTWMYSFAKYLELLCYHNSFTPSMSETSISNTTKELPVNDKSSDYMNDSAALFCSHSSNMGENTIRRCFGKDGKVVIIETSSFSLYEMRVPKVHVFPEHHSMDSDLQSVMSVSSPSISDISISTVLPHNSKSSTALPYLGNPELHKPVMRQFLNNKLFRQFRDEFSAFFSSVFTFVSELRDEIGVVIDAKLSATCLISLQRLEDRVVIIHSEGIEFLEQIVSDHDINVGAILV
jgi:hypothetical protein